MPAAILMPASWASVAAAGCLRRPQRYVLQRHDLRRRTVRRLRINTWAASRVTPDGSADSVIDRLCDVPAEVGDPATHRLDFHVSQFTHFTHMTFLLCM